MADDKIDYIASRIDDVANKVDDLSREITIHVARFEAHLEQASAERVTFARHTDVLNANTISLNEHMRRTDLLETYFKGIEARFTPVELEVARKRAVDEWVKNKIVFFAKLGGAVTAFGGLAAALRVILQHLL